MNRILCVAMLAAGFIGAFVGANIEARQPKLAFDYETCRAIVAKGSLATNPGVPEDWHEMVTTPGGNWCIR